jgi:hypothetical protein
MPGSNSRRPMMDGFVDDPVPHVIDCMTNVLFWRNYFSMWLFAEYRSVALTLSYPPLLMLLLCCCFNIIRPDPK